MTLSASLAVVLTGTLMATAFAGEIKIPVNFSDGHETDPKDRGRPVVLVAAALGVKPEIFRGAFSAVTPARGSDPKPELAQHNKEMLMRVLKPYGITNERLDEVSDYYRYRPERGELWTTRPAEAYAVVENGKIKRIVVTERGSGYSSPPQATVKGFDTVRLKAKIQFSKDLEKNGAIDSVEVVAKDRVGNKR